MLTRAARTMTLITPLTFALTAALLFTPASVRAQTEEVVYYHTDAIGSVRAITDATGAVIEPYDFLPFGEALPSTVPETRQFAGKERDAETGLDYFGARHHMSATGRFTTVDPVMNVEAAMTDPQRWSRYAYAVNRPFVMIDPDGREAGYVYLANGRILSPYDSGFPRSQNPIGDTARLAAVVAGFLFGGPLVEKAAQATHTIVASLTRFFSSGWQQAAGSHTSTRRDQLLSAAENPVLRDAIDNLFRKTATRGDGSSMAAYAHELRTGELLSKSGHGEKLQGRLRQLEKLLRSHLSSTDRKIAEGLVTEIKNVLR